MTGHRPLNILLVGEESAGMQTLKLIRKSPHQLVGVLATPSQSEREASLWNAACKAGAHRLPAEQIRYPEFAAEIDRLEVDVLLNVHSLYLIPGEVLEACRIGAWNLHPGPLPEYAGLDVPGWALYHGETQHGVTVHRMVPKIDAGTIAYQARFDIKPTDNALKVMSACVRHGVPLIQSLLKDLFEDPANVPEIVQDLSQRRYFYRKAPNNGWLDWNRPAADVVNHLRSADYSPFASPWGHPVCRMDGCSVGFVQAVATEQDADVLPGTIGETRDNGVMVAAADHWVLVKTVEVEGQKRPAQEILQEGRQLVSEPAQQCAADH